MREKPNPALSKDLESTFAKFASVQKIKKDDDLNDRLDALILKSETRRKERAERDRIRQLKKQDAELNMEREIEENLKKFEKRKKIETVKNTGKYEISEKMRKAAEKADRLMKKYIIEEETVVMTRVSIIDNKT